MAAAVTALVTAGACAPTTPQVSPRSSPAARGPASEAPSAPSKPSPQLARALGSLWARTPAGCLLVQAGRLVLYQANADAGVQPASLMKILTAAAALDVLGADSRFRTTVTARSAPSGGIIRGDLWLVGGGDPLLATDGRAARFARPQPYTALDVLADRVAAAGVKVVEGQVLGDESRYDRIRYVGTWPDRFITDGESGPLSALTVNDGFATWGDPGQPFANPAAEAASVFQKLLEARGIRVNRKAAAGTAARDAVEVASIESSPLSEILSAMLRESDNGTAEMLTKEMGLQRLGTGSTAAGTAAITQSLMTRGLALAGLSVADGSGLSPLNLVSCRLLTSVLADASLPWRSWLPVAGESGILSRRFLGTPVAGNLQAKTGSLDGVAALAGFARNRAGQSLTFAYVANGLPRSAPARWFQDPLAEALVADSTRLPGPGTAGPPAGDQAGPRQGPAG